LTAPTVNSFKGRFDGHRAARVFKKKNKMHGLQCYALKINLQAGSLHSRLKGDDDDIREKKKRESASERARERGGERRREGEWRDRRQHAACSHVIVMLSLTE